ncbi:hypothetical protein K431DRAFT_323728 [Polychaeton citri CBS 116435]|uniref:Saccharopine dehydrogenase NADP binding domain-containing protein n=1 Tax=Polychaeton citri CBS 116435 TaxID=1314669 RepID=A0A9P4PZ96_9PEZI|nr:hypothetical protein K431DRAFT_323728 [Polychaeton citri CBS 116435]
MAKLLIYGATGYTGRLAGHHAKILDMDFVVGSRKEYKLVSLVKSLGVTYQVFEVHEQQKIDLALEGIGVLLNCARPFMRTARPLIKACTHNSLYYPNIAAILDSYRLAEQYNDQAVEANVMLLQGCGCSVAMLGCLASYATKHVNKPTSIDIALYVVVSMSRGSAISATEDLSTECLQRQDGELVMRESINTINFDFCNDKGGLSSFPVTLLDLIMFWKLTNVTNIRTFIPVSRNAFPSADIASQPDVPTTEQREARPHHKLLLVTRAVLHTVNGYAFTFMASIEAARRVWAGEYKSGFWMPASLFGQDFILSIAESELMQI